MTLAAGRERRAYGRRNVQTTRVAPPAAWRRRANLGGFLEAALTAHVDTLFPGPEAQGFDFPRRPRQ